MTNARILGLCCGLVVLACASASGDVGTISPDALEERLSAEDAPVVLDVRTHGEYAAGHIPGAVNVPYDEVSSRLSELEAYRDREVVVHCQSGKRAEKAESVLEDAGFSRLLHLDGDMAGWKAGGHPVEEGER